MFEIACIDHIVLRTSNPDAMLAFYCDALALNSQADLQQSILGLGKYLTPNIFMNYEIGLYEKESILSLDYILNDRLRLEVESGISQSIDMTFTIEK